MSGFDRRQLKKLVRPLDRKNIKTRSQGSKALRYIEGWFAIAEANAIFGYDGWDREMVHFERVYEKARGSAVACGYTARVRISVRAGESFITREGTGFGGASATDPAEAHDLALKAAETDATKRALSTFGGRFGLCLYGKEKEAPEELHYAHNSSRKTFVLAAPDGSFLAEQLSPESFCTGFRQMIELSNSLSELVEFHRSNLSGLNALRRDAPQLVTRQGTHYADVLERLIAKRKMLLEALQAQTPGVTAASDNSKVTDASVTKIPEKEKYAPAASH